MEFDWQSFIPVKGSLLAGVYAEQLNIFQNDKYLDLLAVELVLKFSKSNSLEFWYWRLAWFEDEEGEDGLLIKEQDTPYPIKYMVEPIAPHQQLIMCSSFSIQDNTIKKVSGYGYKKKQIEIIKTIVFELEKSFLTISAGPIITARMTEKKLGFLGKLIFSTDH